MQPDLSDYTADELIEELSRRHRSMVLVTQNETAAHDEMADAVGVYIFGGTVMAYGLVKSAALRIKHLLSETPGEYDG